LGASQRGSPLAKVNTLPAIWAQSSPVRRMMPMAEMQLPVDMAAMVWDIIGSPLMG
jgi:hypothetical protein